MEQQIFNDLLKKNTYKEKLIKNDNWINEMKQRIQVREDYQEISRTKTSSGINIKYKQNGKIDHQFISYDDMKD